MQLNYLPHLKLIANHALIGCVIMGALFGAHDLPFDPRLIGILLGAGVALFSLQRSQS